MTEMVERGGFLWPADDAWCSKVIFDEVGDIDNALKYVAKRDVAVQAGGNVGVWAAHLAETFGAVYTFEPCAENYECLTRNVPANVIHERAALGDVPGKAGLELVPGNAGAHYLKPGDGEIDVVTIDGLCLDACDLLVLDVEGYEPHALHGAAATIGKFRPVVMMEEKGLSQKYYGITAGAAERWLKREFGYVNVGKVRKDVILAPKK